MAGIQLHGRTLHRWPAAQPIDDLPTAYQKRVLADGGVITSMDAVRAAYAQAAAWGLPPAATHWSSPQFGYKSDGSGGVVLRYCLFGSDASNSAQRGQWPLLPPAGPGKAPQMFTNESPFITRPFAWNSKELSAHIVALANAWEFADGHYPYFPLLEQQDAAYATPFFLAVERTGGVEGGVFRPGSYLGNASFPSIGAQHAYAFLINPGASAPEQQRRVWADGVEATTQFASQLMAGGVWPGRSLLLGGREATAYNWLGNINDVLVTNALLSDTARAWLDNQKDAY